MKPLYIKKNGTVHKVAGVGMPSVYPAGNVSYDNTTSGLTADDTQSAIDELADSVADKADKDGSYSTLTAGQILVNNNLLTTDKTPFLTRQTLNPTGFSGYVREKLVGASYAWNQLLNITTLWENYQWTSETITSNGDNKYTITFSGNETNRAWFIADLANTFDCVAGHKYLLTAHLTISNGTISDAYSVRFQNGNSIINEYLGNVSLKNGGIIPCGSSGTVNRLSMFTGLASSITSSTVITLQLQLTDLTLAFGSTIADYLYNLTNNGGITKLRDMGCPIDKYTPYGYGLYSVKTSGKKIVGKNLVEETIINATIGTDGTITTSGGTSFDMHVARVLQGVTYTIKSDEAQSVSQQFVGGFFYSKPTLNSVSYNGTRLANTSATFISPITGYVAFRTSRGYTVAQCEYGSSQTTYEPYTSTTYPLGNDELRGKFDLVNGEIVASGDVKESNGDVTRYWGYTADMSQLSWTYDSTYTRFWTNNLSNVITRNYETAIMCSCLETSSNALAASGDGICIYPSAGRIYLRKTGITDTTALSTFLSGQKLQYVLATPTTEQSTPFADPMSMVGATIEEYIDNREIPCPVGHETGYYGIGTEGFSMPPAPEKMDNIYKLYYSKNGYGFIPDDFKSKTFSYEYTGATVADTQYNVQNAKANVFGLESKDTIIGMSIYMSMGDTACNFSTPVYNKNSDMFIFKPTDSNATYLTFDGVVFYR